MRRRSATTSPSARGGSAPATGQMTTLRTRPMARPSLSSSGRPVRRAVNTWASGSAARPRAPAVEVTRPLSAQPRHPHADCVTRARASGPGWPARRTSRQTAEIGTSARRQIWHHWHCHDSARLPPKWTRHSRSARRPSPTCSAAGRRGRRAVPAARRADRPAGRHRGAARRASGCRPSARSPRPCPSAATPSRSPTRCCATRAWRRAARARAPGSSRTAPPPRRCTGRTGSSPACCPPRPPTT